MVEIQFVVKMDMPKARANLDLSMSTTKEWDSISSAVVPLPEQ
jgi:hypothetical protein